MNYKIVIVERGLHSLKLLDIFGETLIMAQYACSIIYAAYVLIESNIESNIYNSISKALSRAQLNRTCRTKIIS